MKLNFAKNDLSDIASLGAYQGYWLSTCTDVGNSSASLVDGSFIVDEPNNYMQWTVQITVPLLVALPDACAQAMDANDLMNFQRLGRSSVTFNLMNSFVRAVPQQNITYQPLVIAEKDPIQHKYGVIQYHGVARDNNTGLLAARQLAMRFDPAKPLVWYFAPGYPSDYQQVFIKPGGVQDQTNAVLAASGADAARVQFLNYNDAQAYGDQAGPARQYGDVRYNFIRFESDLDTGSPFLGVTQFVTDPRTGESISASINIAGASYKAQTIQFTDYYLQSIGAAPTTTTTANGTSTVTVGVNLGRVGPGTAQLPGRRCDANRARDRHRGAR